MIGFADVRSCILRALAVLSVTALVACGGGGDSVDDGGETVTNSAPVARAGADITISVGDTAQFDASLSIDSDGIIVSYRWSNNLSGAAAARQYTTAGDYSVVLTVTDNGGLTSTDTLVVHVLPVVESTPERIEIQGANEMLVGATTAFLASVFYSDNIVQNGVEWSVSPISRASISAGGVLTAKEVGDVIITATKRHPEGDVLATFTVNIIEPIAVVVDSIAISGPSSVNVNSSIQLVATLHYSDGHSEQSAVNWSLNNSNATVSASGLLTGLSAGPVVVTAGHSGKFSNAHVINVVEDITPVTLNSISISGPSEVAVQSSIQLIATLHYSNGTTDTGGAVSWSTSNSSIATINGQGLLQGASSGSVVVTVSSAETTPATTETVTITVVSVDPPVVESIDISGPSQVDIGAAVQLSAAVNYDDGSTASDVSWSVADEGIATVSPQGLVTGVSAGSAHITATKDGVTDTHTVTVSENVLDLVSIEIFPKTLRLNSSDVLQQAVAVGTDSSGATFPLTHLVEWSTDNTSIALVSDTGEVTIVDNSIGNAELSATFSGKVGSLTIAPQGRSFDGVNLFFQKPASWANAYLYVWVNNGASQPRGAWPGELMNPVTDVDDWFFAEITDDYLSDDGEVYFKFTSSAAGPQSPNDLTHDRLLGNLWWTDASTSTDLAPDWMGGTATKVLLSVQGAERIYSDENPELNLAGQEVTAGITLNVDVGAVPLGGSFDMWIGDGANYIVDPYSANSRIVVADVGTLPLEAKFNTQIEDGFELGRANFAEQCVDCHGDKGQGSGVFAGVTLSELQASWTSRGETLTVDTLAAYIDAEMPFGSQSENCSGDSAGDCAFEIAAMIFADAWTNQVSVAVGEQHYSAKCSTCHGVEGQGSPGVFPSLRQCSSCSVNTLWQRIELTMPPVNNSQTRGPQDCVGDCAKSVADYILATFQDDIEVYECKADDYRMREVKLLTEIEYRNTIKQLFQLNDAQLPNTDFLNRTLVNGFDNNADVGIVTAGLFEAALQSAADIVEVADASNYLSCNASDPACVLDGFGQKVFRRPLSSAERSRYATLLSQHGSDIAIQAMLASSSFLYRTELGTNNNNLTTTLTDFEIATALSYTLLASTPDDALLSAAASGALHTKAQITAQIERLLLLPRARTTVGRFVSQWMGSPAIINVNKQDALLTPSLRTAMLQETEDFAAHVVFDSTGNYAELFASDYTVVSEELAAYYGYGGAGGKTQYPANTRAGLLGHASILATYSAYNQTSPIKRGLFVRQKLLCQTLPEPPDDVVTAAPKLDPNLTTRERFALHTANPVCSSCHQYIDELGFGFENFDTFGLYRVFENGFPIDANGDLNNIEDLTGANVSNLFEGVAELGGIVAGSNSGKACYALNYYRYTYGDTTNEVDNCKLEPIADEFIQSDGDIIDFMERLLSDESFITRRRAL